MRTRYGFTLIELLVVIAIISLLVSILLPSLNKAKELARLAVCQSNVHNLVTATHVYASDHDKLPSYPSPNPNPLYVGGQQNGTWDNRQAIGGWETPDPINGATVNNFQWLADTRILNPYAGGDGLFKCPSERGYDDNATWGLNDLERYQSWWGIYGCSYFYNAGLGLEMWVPNDAGGYEYRYPTLYGRAVSDVPDPARMIVIGDYTWRYAEAAVWPVSLGIGPYCHVHDPEYQMSMVGFLDGHAAYIEIELDLNTD